MADRQRRCRTCRSRLDPAGPCTVCGAAMTERVRQEVGRLLPVYGPPGVPTGHPAPDPRRPRA